MLLPSIIFLTYVSLLERDFVELNYKPSLYMKKALCLEIEGRSTMTEDGMTAVVVGGSGAVGSNLVKQLVNSTAFTKIILITRRQLDFSSDKIEQKMVNFDKLEDHKEAFSNAQVGFCTLGTTRKKAGAVGFVKVDRDYVAQSAKLLRDQGCQQFHLVTSGGANKDSMFLYMKTKGEAEALVKEMNFPKYIIYRPNMLLSHREESRPLEFITQNTLRYLDRYRWGSIEVERVAAAMVAKASEKPLPDTVHMEILENADILKASKTEN